MSAVSGGGIIGGIKSSPHQSDNTLKKSNLNVSKIEKMKVSYYHWLENPFNKL